MDPQLPGFQDATIPCLIGRLQLMQGSYASIFEISYRLFFVWSVRHWTDGLTLSGLLGSSPPVGWPPDDAPFWHRRAQA
jgi:hypothetical protein